MLRKPPSPTRPNQVKLSLYPTPVAAAATPVATTAKRVLVIDDMDNVHKKVRSLIPPGRNLDGSLNATDALALCRSNPYGLILIDGELPDTNLTSLTKQLRLLQPKAVLVAMALRTEAESQITQRNPKLWIDYPTWMDVVQRCHRPIGLDLAKKWQLPEEIQKAIEECADYDPANRLSTGNAVRFANAVVKQQGIYAGTVSADDNDALVMVGRSLLNIDDETLTRLSSDLKEKSKEAA